MSEKKAFTLIELLVVIAIIAILALLAVGAYGGARRSAQIDLVADGLVSSLKMQQGLSKSGRIDAELSSKCYGMFFTKNPEEGKTQIQYVETPYYAVHPQLQVADVCEINDKTVRKYETDADFDLFMIDMFRTDNETEDLLILFKPPFARVVLFKDNRLVSSATQFSPFINFGVRLPNGENEKYFRFDSSTGLIERIYEAKA